MAKTMAENLLHDFFARLQKSLTASCGYDITLYKV